MLVASWALLGSALGCLLLGRFGTIFGDMMSSCLGVVCRSRRSLLERSCAVFGVSGASPMTPPPDRPRCAGKAWQDALRGPGWAPLRGPSGWPHIPRSWEPSCSQPSCGVGSSF
eukprot:5783915-Pyramimonas_sp.AAC.1